MDDNIRNMIIELDTLKNRRHFLRCKLINFIKDNYKLYPDNFSTGKLYHQRNRKEKLSKKIMFKNLGNICDKELVKDCLIIYREINNQ